MTNIVSHLGVGEKGRYGHIEWDLSNLESQQNNNELDAPRGSVLWEDHIITVTDSSDNNTSDDGENHLEQHEASTIAEWSQTHNPECLSHSVLLFLDHVLDEESCSDRHHQRDIKCHHQREQQCSDRHCRKVDSWILLLICLTGYNIFEVICKAPE